MSNKNCGGCEVLVMDFVSLGTGINTDGHCD